MKLMFLALAVVTVPAVMFNTGLFSQGAHNNTALISPLSSVSNVNNVANEVAESPAAEIAPLVDVAPASAPAVPVVDQQPAARDDAALDKFAASLKNGQAAQVVGVYVQGVMSLQVIQQPTNNPAYVSSQAGTVTQFSLSARYGSIGLLAHNYLAGGYFSALSTGQEVDVIYGNASIRRYAVSLVRHFQALRPLDISSNFIDLDANDGKEISNSALFAQIYVGDRVVFQTCINAHGNSSWGRLFVIATPIP